MVSNLLSFPLVSLYSGIQQSLARNRKDDDDDKDYGDNSSKYFHSAYYVPGPGLGASYTSIYVVFRITLRDLYFYI